MTVDDRWYKKDPKTGDKVPSARHGRGMRWRVRNPGYREQLFERKTDAEKVDASQRGRIVAGKLPWDPSNGAVTFEQYATRVVESRYTREIISERTYRKYMGQLRKHVFPFMGHRTMNDIDARVIKDWLAFLGGQISHKTGEPIGLSAVNLLWNVVGSIFGEAQTDRVKPEHPMASVERVAKQQSPKVRPWSRGLVDTVLSNIDVRDRGPASMSVMVGARPGESLAISLGDVSANRRRLTIRHGVIYGGNGGVRLAPVKNGRREDRERSVPLPPDAARMIDATVRQWGTVRVWCDCHKRYNDVVFHDRGQLWSPRRYTSRVWLPAVRAAGLVDADGKPTSKATGRDDERPALRLVTDDDADTAADDDVDVRPGQHQLRHYYASAEIAEGASPAVVRSHLGHKSMETTIQIYTHLFDDQEDALADKINARMAGLPILAGLDESGGADPTADPTGTGE